MHDEVSRLLTVFSMFPVCQELSDSGWFNEGFDHFLQEVISCFLRFLAGIHKETPMFLTEKSLITARNLTDLREYEPVSDVITRKRQ